MELVLGICAAIGAAIVFLVLNHRKTPPPDKPLETEEPRTSHGYRLYPGISRDSLDIPKAEQERPTSGGFRVTYNVPKGTQVEDAARRNTAEANRQSRHVEADNDDDDPDDESWFSRRHPVGTFARPAGMVVLPGCSAIRLKGTAMRAEGIRALTDTATKSPASVTLHLRREPDNPHDPNAMMIVGEVSPRLQIDLGYVPSELAAKLAATFRDDMPLVPELVSSGYLRSMEAAYVKVRLLGPAAGARRQFQR